jgi:hypothetical protein
VVTSDGPHLLWATVHFIMNARPAQGRRGKLRAQAPSVPRSRRRCG